MLAIAPPVEVQTPPSFKASTTSAKVTARSSDDFSVCDSLSRDPEGPDSEFSKCIAIVQVKSRFFSPSPTELRGVLADADGTVSGMFNGGTDYVPCLDTSNTTGGSVGDQNYVAYSQADFSLNKTFADGSSYDTGVTYSLSCVRSNDLDDSWSGIGVKDGTTYVIKAGSSNNGLAIIDANTNIDYWFNVNGVNANFDPANPEENHGPTGTQSTEMTYEGSTGLIHVRSNAGKNTIELAMTGAGLGDGCSTRLITDGSYLFYEANRNYYARCAADDTSATIYDDTGVITATYDATYDNVNYCFDVSGDTPVVVNDTNVCTTRGLSADDFSIAQISRADIKAYNVSYLFPEMPTNVPELVSIPRNVEIIVDASDLATYAENNIYLPNVIQDINRTAGFCGSRADVTNGAINTEFELDLSTISAAELEALNNADVVRIYAQVDNGLTEKSSYSYWADFSATVRLFQNNQPVGIPLEIFTDTDDGIQDIGFAFTNETFGATDKIKITMTGTTLYQCSEDAANLGSAAAGVGMGRVRLAYYTPPANN